ncbi:MAG: cytochrome P450 [Acidimicrobiaceae bacterium]|nr:cytochrome P450 [Acidimicrobiaceae bacterium]
MTDVPVINVTFYEPGFNQAPYPVLEEIRAAGPIVYNELLDRFVVTSYPNVTQVMGDATRFAQGASEAFVDFFGGQTMETIDDQERHDAVRGIWARDFWRGTLERQRPMVEEVVAGQLRPFIDRVRSGEVVDAVADLARGIPTLVIARMLGIETSMFKQFSAWSDAMGAIPEGALDQTERGTQIITAGRRATAELNAYISDQVAARRKQPTDDLISKMVSSEYARTSMSEQEIVASNTQLVFAGNETTAKLMAHTLVTLARHPEQRRMVAADRSLVAATIEEVLRWETITQFIDRDVRADDVVIAGVPVARGKSVTAMQGAANRDPDRWDDPGSFDITREPRQHVGFGFGLHSCIGLNLARMEAQVWLNQLLDELPEYELAGDISYGGNFQLRGPEAVPVSAG